MIRIKNSFWIIIGLLSVFIIVTLPLSLRSSLKSDSVSVAQPFLTLTTVTIEKIAKHTKAVFSYFSLLKENEKLKIQIFELEEKVVSLEEASRENQRLRGLLLFKKDSDWTLLPARVIGRDSSLWFNSILINKGKKHGIREGMPVISQGGLTGRVISAGTLASQVRLITDINSRVSVIVQDSREAGVSMGQGTNLVNIKYLSMTSGLRVDDLVITSGLDQLYPKGLVVGKIFSIRPEPDGVTRTALVRPSVDLFRLEEVLCLDIENGL